MIVNVILFPLGKRCIKMIEN